jgi:uncharacterized protein YjbJ (UPF0337 family)
MNWDRIVADWGRFKGFIRLHWPKITDEQLDAIAGERGQLVEIIQTAYGMSREQVEQQLSNWQASRQRESEAAN